jgi:hypothetical protein
MHLLKDLVIVFIILMTVVFAVDYVTSPMIEKSPETWYPFSELYCKGLISRHVPVQLRFTNNTGFVGNMRTSDFRAHYNDTMYSYAAHYKIFHTSSGDEVPYCSVLVVSDEPISGDYYDCENMRISFSSEKTKNYFTIEVHVYRNKQISKYQYINPDNKYIYDNELRKLEDQVSSCTR